MSQHEAPLRQTSVSEAEKYAQATRIAATVAVVACPVLILLPPRKLDFYTIALIGTTGYSANHLIRESTGRSIWQRVMLQQNDPCIQSVPTTSRSLAAEIQAQSRRPESPKDHVGGLHKQREEWKTQRKKEIEEEIEEGKGFGDMIVDQIWEVWNWGKPKEDDDRSDK